MTKDELLANIPTDKDIANINALNAAALLADRFLEKIDLEVNLTFNNTSVEIFFLCFEPSSPIPELPYTGVYYNTSVCDDIGFAFTVFYKYLNNYTEILQDFEPCEKRLDDVYNLFSDLSLLKTAIFALDNAAKTPDTLMDKLSIFTSPRMGPIYGIRDIKDINDVDSIPSLMRYINCAEPDYKGFLGFLQNEMHYTYHCKNLYQICGSILDYLCQYKRYDDYTTKPHTLSLRKCPRCGRYFVTEDRKIMYCHYTDMDGKTCADWQEADRKKLLAQTPKSEAEQLAEKIRRRLYSYRTNVKTSRYDHTDDLRFEERDKLYKLYTKCRKEQSQSPHFSEWITECAAQLPKSRSESYDKFYEWLLERST